MSSQAREHGLRQDPHQGRCGTQPGAELDGVGLPIMEAWRKEIKDDGDGKRPMECLLPMGKAMVGPNMSYLFFQRLPVSYFPQSSGISNRTCEPPSAWKETSRVGTTLKFHLWHRRADKILLSVRQSLKWASRSGCSPRKFSPSPESPRSYPGQGE